MILDVPEWLSVVSDFHLSLFLGGVILVESPMQGQPVVQCGSSTADLIRRVRIDWVPLLCPHHFSVKILSLALLPVPTCAKHSWLFLVACASASCSWKADWKVPNFLFDFPIFQGRSFLSCRWSPSQPLFQLPLWKELGLGCKIRALKQDGSDSADSSVLTRMVSRRLRHFASHFHSCDPRRILHGASAREATAFFFSDVSILKWS